MSDTDERVPREVSEKIADIVDERFADDDGIWQLPEEVKETIIEITDGLVEDQDEGEALRDAVLIETTCLVLQQRILYRGTGKRPEAARQDRCSVVHNKASSFPYSLGRAVLDEGSGQEWVVGRRGRMCASGGTDQLSHCADDSTQDGFGNGRKVAILCWDGHLGARVAWHGLRLEHVASCVGKPPHPSLPLGISARRVGEASE